MLLRHPYRFIRRGFSLIEVVIALAVMTMIGTISLMTITSTLDVRNTLTEQDELYRSMRVGMDRIKKELRVAFLTKQQGAIGTYQTVFIGKDGGDVDTLWFAHLSHKRKYYNAIEGDQAEVTLFVEDGPKELGDILMHRESGRVDNEPAKSGAVLPLIPHVKEFNLRYLNRETNEWADEWDTTGAETPNQLPRAVEIRLTIKRRDPEDPVDYLEKTILSTVILELSKPMKKSLLAGSGSNGSPLGGMMR